MTAEAPLSGMAAAWAEAQVRVHEALHPHQRRRADERLTSWLDSFEADMRDVLAPHLAKWVDHPDTPPEVAELFRVATGPEHAAQVGILLAFVGALAYPLISAAVSPVASEVAQNAFKFRQVTPLSPQEIASAMVKHTLNGVDPNSEAHKSGIDDQRLETLRQTLGNPPGLGELLLLLRRRQINLLRFQQGIQESFLRDDWMPEWEALKFSPPGAGEVLAGALKHWLDDTTAAGMLSEAGIDPANYDWMRKTAGRPPGIETMVQLWNHAQAGLAGFTATQADVEQAIAQSDINDHFTPFVLESRWYIPPVRSVMPMLRAGAITDPQASQLLAAHGVRAEDIPHYLAEGHHTRSATIKGLSVSQITRLYEEHLLDRATAHNRIVGLGFNDADANLALDLADATRAETEQRAYASSIRSLYVAHKMNQAEATTALAADGIPAAAIGHYLKLWTVERNAHVYHPTPAMIVGAYRRAEITAADTKARLLALGIQQGDLAIIVADGYPPTHPNPAAVAAVVNA